MLYAFNLLLNEYNTARGDMLSLCFIQTYEPEATSKFGRLRHFVWGVVRGGLLIYKGIKCLESNPRCAYST